MILGLGTDLIDSRRIEKALSRFGQVFIRRVFTDKEITFCEERKNNKKVLAYALRFSAKEACSKALGTGMNGIGWRDIEVVSSPSGKPDIVLGGRAAEVLKTLTPEGCTPQINVSLSDEPPYGTATVIISANEVIHGR